MQFDAGERGLRERFEAVYVTSQAPAMLAVERSVFGCDYGATSWTTAEEALRLGTMLALRRGVRLLEIGGGSGWPALYLAKATGCDVVLTDLPLSGLRIAARRIRDDRVSGTCRVAAADGARLPFRAASFDAISHSDVLCCLARKREVLASCRGVIRAGGRMVFSVIAIARGLAPAAHSRAIANGPDFVEAEPDYPALLRETGWTAVERHDVTAVFAATCRRQLRADIEQEVALTALLGAAVVAERRSGWQAKMACIDDGLLRRDVYVANAGA